MWNLFGYEDDFDYRSKLVFPRRDLIQELGGHDQYQELVRDALALECRRDGDGNERTEDDDDVVVEGDKDSTPRYGVDISFPMHYDLNIPGGSDNGMSSRNLDEEVSDIKKSQAAIYQNYMESCNGYYSPKTTDVSLKILCNNAEKDRLDMNLNQPRMMQNYTMLGFQKTKIPNDLYHQLKTFWNKHHMKQKREAWGKGGGDESSDVDERGISVDTHVNHWLSPTYMVHIDNPYFQGGGMELKNYIWHVARQELEEWINNGGGGGVSNSLHGGKSKNDDQRKWTLSPTSMYGIRVYKENSVLAPHVDRLPLVTSAIINVAQDVDEDWPLEVIGHDGLSYNITMEPGDMLLYESHSVIHGRPYPLKGRYYANIFVHFEPSGHTMRHSDRLDGKDVVIDDARALYESARKRSQRQENEQTKQKIIKKAQQQGNGFDESKNRQPSTPYYVPRGTIEEKRWNQQLEYEKDLANDMKQETFSIHIIAGRGRLEDVMFLVKNDPPSASYKDSNGWQPLHEAVRGGHLDVVQFLVGSAKVDINARTGNDGYGGSPLWWAKKFHGDDHSITTYLEEQNASNITPGSPKTKVVKNMDPMMKKTNTNNDEL